MKHIVSFSGGKDSTAMLLMMIEKGMTVDEIICCDTGVEYPTMYDHWKKVEEYIDRPITILKEPHGFLYWLLNHEYYSRYRETGEITFKKGRSWPRPRARWCTKTLKTSLTDSYLRKKYGGKDNYVQYIGIAYDEPKRHKNIPQNVIHPLYEWQITEKDALQYCYDRGFRWGGLYEIFSRVSCWLCPLQRISELRKLRKHFPDLWKKLQDLDKKARTDFKSGYSVEILEERFAKEEKWEQMQMRLF